MHTTLFVTCHIKDLPTSLAARRFISATLERVRGFCVPASSDGIADWFVIGGRASGVLTNASQGSATTRAATVRDPYRPLGYADDAMLVSPRLYVAVLQPFAGQSEGHIDDTLVFLDLDDEPVSEAFLSTKWIVVVDYHA